MLFEADGGDTSFRYRDVLTHQVKTSVYVLLHSETREPLTWQPQRTMACATKPDRPYITTPKEARENWCR